MVKINLQFGVLVHPLREFLYVDDLSNFINFIIDKDIKNDLINVGSGEEISIKNLALLIQELMRF